MKIMVKIYINGCKLSNKVASEVVQVQGAKISKECLINLYIKGISMNKVKIIFSWVCLRSYG